MPKTKILQYFFIVIAAALLLLPRAQETFGMFSLPKLNENREKVKRPDGTLLFSPLVDQQFSAAFERWYNDVYGMRDLFVMLRHQIEFDFFQYSKQVIIGRDGWLFDRYVTESAMVKLDSQTDREWKRLFGRFHRLEATLAARGIQLVVLPIPDKSTVMPEYYAATIRRPVPNGWQHFMTFLRGSGIPYIDVETALRRSKAEHPVFYKTDIHWTSYGATLAAQLLVKRLGELAGTHTQWIHKMDFETQRYNSGGESRAMGLLRPISEITTLVRPVPNEIGLQQSPPPEPFRAYYKTSGRVSIKPLPKTVLIGNSFNAMLEPTGLLEYFTDIYHLYDMVYFPGSDDIIPPGTKFAVLQIYEIELIGQLTFDNWWRRFDDASHDDHQR